MADSNGNGSNNGLFGDKIKSWIQQLGFPIVVSVYFIAKDYLYTDKTVELLTKISQLLDQLTKICIK